MRERGGAPRNASDREADARAARAAGEPLARRAGQGLVYESDQLPAIVSTGLNAPCSTL